MTFRPRRGVPVIASLAAAGISLAACGSGTVGTTVAPAGRTGATSSTSTSTTTTVGRGDGGGSGTLGTVSILSHNGPFGPATTAIAATSLSQLRSDAHCSGQTCWLDAKVTGAQLLLATTVEPCRPVVRAAGWLDRAATTLHVTVVHGPGSGPDTACTGTVPRLWLFAVPLASLPHHVTLTIEVAGGQSIGTSTATTTVALP